MYKFYMLSDLYLADGYFFNSPLHQVFLNYYLVNVPFYSTLKHQKTGDFRDYKMGILTKKGLIQL